MVEKVCATCDDKITLISGRSKTKDGHLLCMSCTAVAGNNTFKIRRQTLSEIMTIYTGFKNSTERKESRSIQKQEKQEIRATAKASIKENKKLSKGKPSSFCRFTAAGVANTPFKWKAGVGFNELAQLTAGRIMIDYEYEYTLLNFTWTPKVKGQKNFSVGKALTGAALIGATGLIAGASGKKGEDDSEILLTLKDGQSGEVFKVLGKMNPAAAESMSMFITAVEAGIEN